MLLVLCRFYHSKNYCRDLVNPYISPTGIPALSVHDIKKQLLMFVVILISPIKLLVPFSSNDGGFIATDPQIWATEQMYAGDALSFCFDTLFSVLVCIKGPLGCSWQRERGSWGYMWMWSISFSSRCWYKLWLVRQGSLLPPYIFISHAFLFRYLICSSFYLFVFALRVLHCLVSSFSLFKGSIFCYKVFSICYIFNAITCFLWAASFILLLVLSTLPVEGQLELLR